MPHSTCRAALAAALLLAGCTRRPAPNEQVARGDAAAIRAERAEQNRAMAAGDAERAAAVWTEDVTLRRGLGQAVSGREAYRRLIEEAPRGDSAVVYVREPDAVEVSAAWPLAFETGRWTGRLGSATGPVVVGGSYSAQWVKRDGRWLIRSEVFVALTCGGEGCRFAAAP